MGRQVGAPGVCPLSVADLERMVDVQGLVSGRESVVAAQGKMSPVAPCLVPGLFVGKVQRTPLYCAAPTEKKVVLKRKLSKLFCLAIEHCNTF